MTHTTIAIAAVLGGWALTAGGARGPAWAAATACLLAAPLVWRVTRLRDPGEPTSPGSDEPASSARRASR